MYNYSMIVEFSHKIGPSRARRETAKSLEWSWSREWITDLVCSHRRSHDCLLDAQQLINYYYKTQNKRIDIPDG